MCVTLTFACKKHELAFSEGDSSLCTHHWYDCCQSLNSDGLELLMKSVRRLDQIYLVRQIKLNATIAKKERQRCKILQTFLNLKSVGNRWPVPLGKVFTVRSRALMTILLMCVNSPQMFFCVFFFTLGCWINVLILHTEHSDINLTDISIC